MYANMYACVQVCARVLRIVIAHCDCVVASTCSSTVGYVRMCWCNVCVLVRMCTSMCTCMSIYLRMVRVCTHVIVYAHVYGYFSIGKGYAMHITCSALF